jgi:hypothetical protein
LEAMQMSPAMVAPMAPTAAALALVHKLCRPGPANAAGSNLLH